MSMPLVTSEAANRRMPVEIVLVNGRYHVDHLPGSALLFFIVGIEFMSHVAKLAISI
jgi:hypothetical protein